MLETFDELTSNNSAKVSMHGYFLMQINVNKTLIRLLSLELPTFRRSPPRVVIRFKFLDILAAMSNIVSGTVALLYLTKTDIVCSQSSEIYLSP